MVGVILGAAVGVNGRTIACSSLLKWYCSIDQSCMGFSVFSDDKTTGSFIYENTVENCVSSKTLDKQIEQNSISYIKKIIHPDPDPFTPTAAPDQFKSKEQEDIWMVGAGCGHFKRIGSAVEGLNNWNPECGSCILFSDSNFKNSHQSAIVMLMDQYSSDECKGHPQLDQAWV